MADTTGFDFASFMKSPAGAALINSIGGGLSAYGQKQSEDANRTQNAGQFTTNTYMAQNAQNSQNASGVLNANPLGADQKFAQSNALLAAILPGLRNQHTTPGDAAVAGAMPTSTGGLRLPEGGLDPAMIQSMFGSGATANSIATHQKNSLNLDPRAATTNLGNLYGAGAAGEQQGVNDFRTQRLDDQAKQQALIQQAIQGSAGQQQGDDGSGFWHKLVKYVAPIAGVVAAPFTGGASLALAGAAEGWANGGGAKGALLGGLGGAGGAYAGQLGGLFKPKTPGYAPSNTNGYG